MSFRNSFEAILYLANELECALNLSISSYCTFVQYKTRCKIEIELVTKLRMADKPNRVR